MMPRTAHDGPAPRRVPCVVAYLHPFRVVVEGVETWSSTIEEINNGEWDYVALHEVIGGIDVGMPAPYHMLVCRDGALALPVVPAIRSDEKLVEFFNKILGALLLGGVFAEAIDIDGVSQAAVFDWKYVRIFSAGRSAASGFHNRIRLKAASAHEAIPLLQPSSVTLTELRTAMAAGLAVLERIPQLNVSFLLLGVSALASRNWSQALANLWIVVEQLTSHLWEREVIAHLPKVSKARRDQLSDTRSYTASVRHEFLCHQGVLDEKTLTKLALARRARNTLQHEGTYSGAPPAAAAYAAMLALLRIAAGELLVPLADVNLDEHTREDPFNPRPRGPLNPKFWMEIPKLPGEAEYEKEEAKRRSGDKS